LINGKEEGKEEGYFGTYIFDDEYKIATFSSGADYSEFFVCKNPKE